MDSRIAEFEAGRQQDGSGRFLRGYADLLTVAVLTVATVGITLAYGEQGGPALIRVPLGFLFVFLLPGYAITAALFPGTTVGPARSFSFSIGVVERLVLSVGLSLAVVPLVSIGLALLSVALTAQSVMLTLGTIILATTGVAGVRTFNTSPQQRFSLSPRRRLNRQNLRLDKVTVLFVLALVLAGGGLTAAIVGSEGTDTYTELAVQSPDEDGEPSPEELPDVMSLEEPERLHVEIENHEHRTAGYTLVVVLEEIDGDAVVERAELDRLTTELSHSERAVLEHELEPTMTGDELRVSYLLYLDEPPEEPTLSNADRSVHFFTDVSENDG